LDVGLAVQELRAKLLADMRREKNGTPIGEQTTGRKGGRLKGQKRMDIESDLRGGMAPGAIVFKRNVTISYVNRIKRELPGD
jgi:hypothetical protein